MKQLTPKQFYEKSRIEGDINNITSNPNPDYDNSLRRTRKYSSPT
jgi:hypothetical protein